MENSRSEQELVAKINELRQERKAIILAHNYQIGEVQDIADLVGDSLELSRKAAATDAQVIVFCGVQFMAETAAILCPEKTVLIPDPEAGCPLADMITVEQLRQEKAKYPGVPVVCYVNSSAEVKAESDICCTSANAVEVIDSLAEDTVIFVPDYCLGQYAAAQTKKKVILWQGFCYAHHRILADDIRRLQREHPQAEVWVHPECTWDVIQLADHVLSTGGMIKRAPKSPAPEIIVGTEKGIIHRLKKENPDKEFYPTSENVICANMKLITLGKVLWSLQDMQHRVEVDEPIRARAQRGIDRMLEVK